MAVRFLLRFVLVPLGMFVASLAGLAVVVAAGWSKISATLSADPQAGENFAAVIFVFGPVLVTVWSVATMAILTPFILGIAVSETLAIRSWIFHTIVGAVSGYVGWSGFAAHRDAYDQVFDTPTVAVAMGIAGGFGYWLVAGRGAGFWKPAGRSLSAPAAATRAE